MDQQDRQRQNMDQIYENSSQCVQISREAYVRQELNNNNIYQESIRNIGSASTNLDTPPEFLPPEQEETRMQVDSNSERRYKRLVKANERRGKVKRFLMKKKTIQVRKVNRRTDSCYPKRLRHPLLTFKDPQNSTNPSKADFNETKLYQLSEYIEIATQKAHQVIFNPSNFIRAPFSHITKNIQQVHTVQQTVQKNILKFNTSFSSSSQQQNLPTTITTTTNNNNITQTLQQQLQTIAKNIQQKYLTKTIQQMNQLNDPNNKVEKIQNLAFMMYMIQENKECKSDEQVNTIVDNDPLEFEIEKRRNFDIQGSQSDVQTS